MKKDIKAWDEMIQDPSKMTEKQKKIIEAAIVMFSEKGYASTSTQEIAKRAGVAEGTIFRHFKTKKDLLLSIVAPTMVKLLAPFFIKDLKKVLDKEHDHFEDFLRALIYNRHTFLKENLTICKIIIQEVPFHPELKDQIIKHIGRKVYDRLVELVRSYQEKGEITDMPVSTIVRLTASAIAGFLMTRHIITPGNEWDDEVEIENTIQFICNGLRQ